MTQNNNSRPSRRTRTLLAGVAALGITGIFAGEQFFSSAGPAHAQDAVNTEPFATAAAFPSFADVVERVQPAVVSIRVRAPAEGVAFEGGSPFPDGHPLEEFFRRFGQPGGGGSPFGGDGGRNGGRGEQQFTMGQGSGFFISADGYIVTNNHVVENADEVTVTLDDGSTFDATVIGTDPKTDLALVKVDADQEFDFVELSSSDIRVGDWVVAVGNPFGLGGSVTAGIVSARGRDIGAGPYDDFLQIDASINRGNSGGPAFDLQGNVVGVNTAIYSPSGGSVGIGFAIPAATVRQVVEDLREDGVVTRGWLGVQIQPVNEAIADSIGLDTASGALVTEPQPDSPAAAAGIESGDVILSVEGSPVADARELSRRIAGFAPDTEVSLGLWRDGEAMDVAVTLGTMPNEEQVAGLQNGGGAAQPSQLEDYGLSLAPAASVGAGDAGVVVTEIDPSGTAAEQGLQQGDIILEVAGQPVANAGDVQTQIDAALENGRKAVLMRVESDSQVRFLALPLDLA
jgi:serine protease Do